MFPNFRFVHDQRWTKRTCRIYSTTRESNLRFTLNKKDQENELPTTDEVFNALSSACLRPLVLAWQGSNPSPSAELGSFSNDNGDGNENVTNVHI